MKLDFFYEVSKIGFQTLLPNLNFVTHKGGTLILYYAYTNYKLYYSKQTRISNVIDGIITQKINKIKIAKNNDTKSHIIILSPVSNIILDTPNINSEFLEVKIDKTVPDTNIIPLILK